MMDNKKRAGQTGEISFRGATVERGSPCMELVGSQSTYAADTLEIRAEAIGMFARPFYFLRHGETEANASGIISGSLDVELTALGRKQAQAAARTLFAEPITAVYSSPLRRARETAEPVAHTLGLSIEIVPELIERRRGELEGKPRDTRIEGAASTDVETFEEFIQRVLKGLSQVDSRVPIVIAHLGVFRVLCHTLEIAGAEGTLGNALPLRFVPLTAKGWTLETLT